MKPKKEPTILEKLADLHKQATEERTHYYTGSVIREAIAEIMWLEMKVRDLSEPKK